MSPRKVSPQRARLGDRLRELRAARFRSGAAPARHLDWQQTRVSKLELGAQLPSDEDLDTWVAATGAGPDVRAELGERIRRQALLSEPRRQIPILPLGGFSIHDDDTL